MEYDSRKQEPHDAACSNWKWVENSRAMQRSRERDSQTVKLVAGARRFRRYSFGQSLAGVLEGKLSGMSTALQGLHVQLLIWHQQLTTENKSFVHQTNPDHTYVYHTSPYYFPIVSTFRIPDAACRSAKRPDAVSVCARQMGRKRALEVGVVLWSTVDIIGSPEATTFVVGSLCQSDHTES